jgi:TolA-binding protein
MAPSPGSGAFASTILATEGAKWSRERVGSTETVRLSDGELRIHVRHQLTEERFVVVLPDGELEVRGTTFDVRVERGSTSIVRVEEGRVALRMAGRAERLLGGGESWSAQPPAVAAHASVAGATAAADHSSRRNGPLHAGAPAPRTPVAADDAAHAYAAALGLLSARQFGPSATAFHDFVAAHPNAPQAEDASFLEAVALARAGRADAAALVAERHLQAYPESFHGKDAAILVARSARDRGDCPKVRAVLAAALDARDGAALAAAGACAYTYRASASDGGGRALPSR